MKYKLAALVFSASTFVGCDNSKNQTRDNSNQAPDNSKLTRELAKEILDKKLSKPEPQDISFHENGWKQFQALGFIAPNKYDTMYLTELGEKRFPILYDRSNPAPGLVAQTNVHLTVFEKVKEVTGIKEEAPGHAEVNYVTEYVFPPNAKDLAPFFYTGKKRRSSFAKYDDGWRIEND